LRADLLKFDKNLGEMKAPLFFLLFFFSLLPACRAQIYIGPMAGGKLSWTKFDNRDLYQSYDLKPVFGYQAGANISLKVRNRFFLHTSFLYSTKGKKLEGNLDPMLKNRVRYNYIDVPIIYAVDFRARLGSGKEFKYYFGIGPTVSYWLGGKGTLYNSDLDENADFASRDLEYTIVFRQEAGDVPSTQMNVAEPNRLQLGLNIASGFVFEPRPDQRILLLLRYELGHSFLSGDSNGIFLSTYYEDVLQARNKGISLSVSYMIDLKIENRKRGKSTIKRKRL
jgi:hypothetical protein